MTLVKRRPPSPKSWAELVQQRETDRLRAPPPEAYQRVRGKRLIEAGVIYAAAPEKPVTVDVDPHIYQTTSLFDPPEPQPCRFRKLVEDHGIDLVRWDTRTPEQLEADNQKIYEARKARGFTRSLMDQGAMRPEDEVEQKAREEREGQIRQRWLEAKAKREAARPEEEAWQAARAWKLKRLPANERRAEGLDLLTGEGEAVPACGRAALAAKREQELVARREAEAAVWGDRLMGRFNTVGRVRDHRPWNIINGSPMLAALSPAIKPRPTPAQVLQAEAKAD